MEPNTGGHLTVFDFEGVLNRLDGECNQSSDILLAHLDMCAACRSRFARYRKQMEALRSLCAEPGVLISESCPEPGKWPLLIAGLITEPESEKLLDHAIDCDACGALLRESVEDLNAVEIPPEALPATSHEFGKYVAQRLRSQCAPRQATTVVERRTGSRFVSVLTYLAAAVVVLIVVATVVDRFRKAPEYLLARAYEEGRTGPVRFPHADFVPQTSVVRSEGTRSAVLAEAEAEILRALEKQPVDRRWQQLQGRLDFLRRRYDSAIATIQPLASEDATADIFMDLGMVHLARGLADANPSDYERATEYLSRGLEKKPDDPVGLFNRGLALEALFLWDRAQQDWANYLRIDSTSGWADEAKQHLDLVRQKKSSWRRDLKALQLTAEEFSASYRSGRDLPTEAYLDVAFTDWLPTLRKPAGSQHVAALGTLASILARRHQDQLLLDLLRQGNLLASSEAVRELAEAIRMNMAGSREEGHRRARIAAELFRVSGNSAGALRAEVESVYALSRSYETVKCIDTSGALLRKIGDRPYPWIRVQALLARAACLGHIGDFTGAHSLYAKAIRLAEQHHYLQLHLRAIGLDAASRTMVGDVDNARQLDYQGLSRFWAGTFSAMRAYQFYSDLSHIAEHNERWHTAYLTSKEAISAIQMTGNLATEAMARYRLATFAGLTGKNIESLVETRLANELFGRLPEQYAAILRAENAILMVKSYLQNNSFDLARTALATVSTSDVKASVRLQIGYQDLRGALALHSRQLDAAWDAFSSAVSAAEGGFRETRPLRERAIWQRDTAHIYRHLIRLVIDRDHDLEWALHLWERYRSVPVQRERAVPREFSLKRFSRHLDRTTVLSFVQFDDYLQGWVFDDRGIYPFQSNLSRKAAQVVCSQFANLTSSSTSNSEMLRSVSRELYERLLGPVEDRLLDRRTLAIEPDGPCSGIAFEALVDRNGAYLIDRMALMTSPGAAAAETLSSSDHHVHMGLRALSIGDPRVTGDIGETYPGLPDARAEAFEMVKHFRNGTVLVGRSATLERIQAALRDAEVFHFSGHGVSTSEEGTLLVSSTDSSNGASLLNSEGIENNVPRCRLAVLSACHTAVGERMGPFNPHSLVQALWREGVPNVLATRWAIDTRAARHLMRDFYVRLLEGWPPPIALRLAVQSIRSTAAFRHPAHWAGFHVFGSPIFKQ